MARPRAPEEWLDSELLVAIARHDQKACAVFYRRHLPRTVGYLMRETRDPELVEALPVGERHAVKAHVLYERSYSEIAASLQCSEMVVRKRVSRGLARIRQTLEGGS